MKGRSFKVKTTATLMAMLFLASITVVAVIPVLATNTVTNLNTGETFTTIQAAIDDPDTVDGHTIEVGPGTYIENVVVHKDITVRGVDRPVVVGVVVGVYAPWAWDVFRVIAAGATVEGFEVRIEDAHDGIAVKADGVTVRNNVVKGQGPWLTTPGWYPPTGAGISVIDCVGVLVEGNSVHETTGAGIWLGSISHCTIRNNKVAETQYTGILLTDYYFFIRQPEKPSHDNTIENNHVASAGTEWNYDDGIRLGYKAYDNQVLRNHVTASIRDGIRAVGTTHGNEIAFNKMRGNGIPATGGVDAREQAASGANDWHDNHFRTSSGPVSG